MFSLLIKNARVIDGVSDTSEIMDVAVEGDTVVNVGRNLPGQAQTVLDAAGKILAPGFIDLQNHSDGYWQIFDNPGLESLVTQGFTTILMGNCGASLAPLLSREALLSVQKWHNLEAANINWQNFKEYLGELGKRKFSCNVASLVGYSTLRRGITGDQIRGLKPEEMKILSAALKESLKAGAFGLSSGLSYAHEIIISELELYELTKILKDSERLFSLHLRSEGSEITEALMEALDVAGHTGVNLKISHFKIRDEQNWGKFNQAIDLIEAAYHRGVNVHFDVYPYDTVWQVLYSYLPKWAIEGGRKIMLKNLADPVQRNKILSYLNNSPAKLRSLRVASTANKLNFAGKTVSEIAKNMGVSSEQAILHLLENGGSEILVFEQNLCQEHVEKLLAHPLSIIATDGGGFGLNQRLNLAHPRCFGSATKFLRWAIDKKAVTLEEAVKKLTSVPAAKAGFEKRGQIKPGYFADLVILDENKVKDRASYENPYQYSIGVEQVFVNGRAVIRDGGLTGDLPGKVLKKGQ